MHIYSILIIHLVLQKLFLPSNFLCYSMGQVGCTVAYDDKGVKYELDRGGKDAFIQASIGIHLCLSHLIFFYYKYSLILSSSYPLILSFSRFFVFLFFCSLFFFVLCSCFFCFVFCLFVLFVLFFEKKKEKGDI